MSGKRRPSHPQKSITTKDAGKQSTVPIEVKVSTPAKIDVEPAHSTPVKIIFPDTKDADEPRPKKRRRGVDNKNVQTDLCEDRVVQELRAEVQNLRLKIKNINSPSFVVKQSEEPGKFYTGLSQNHRTILWDFLGSEEDKKCLKLYKSTKTCGQLRLPIYDQFLLCLIKLRRGLTYKEMRFRFKINTLFMCQVEISIRDSNFDPKPKFRKWNRIFVQKPKFPETQISIFELKTEIWFKTIFKPNFDYLNQISIFERNFGFGSKFGFRIDENLSPGSKFESRIEISTWHINRLRIATPAKPGKRLIFRKVVLGIEWPKLSDFWTPSDPYLNSMCTKFGLDWSTGFYENGRFSKSRSKRYYRHFGESRKKVNLSESGSRDRVNQIVWNLDTFQIHIWPQCIPNFVQIGQPDHMKKTVFQRVVSKRCYHSFGEIRKKANLSESGSGDWLYQIVVKTWTPVRFIILTHHVYQISLTLGHRIIWKKPFVKEKFEALTTLWRKSKKGQSFRKRFTRLTVPNCPKFVHL